MGSGGFDSGVFGAASTGFGAGGVLGRGAEGSDTVPDALGNAGVTGGGAGGGAVAGGRLSRVGSAVAGIFCGAALVWRSDRFADPGREASPRVELRSVRRAVSCGADGCATRSADGG